MDAEQKRHPKEGRPVTMDAVELGTVEHRVSLDPRLKDDERAALHDMLESLGKRDTGSDGPMESIGRLSKRAPAASDRCGTEALGIHTTDTRGRMETGKSRADHIVDRLPTDVAQGCKLDRQLIGRCVRRLRPPNDRSDDRSYMRGEYVLMHKIRNEGPWVLSDDVQLYRDRAPQPGHFINGALYDDGWESVVVSQPAERLRE